MAGSKAIPIRLGRVLVSGSQGGVHHGSRRTVIKSGRRHDHQRHTEQVCRDRPRAAQWQVAGEWSRSLPKCRASVVTLGKLPSHSYSAPA